MKQNDGWWWWSLDTNNQQQTNVRASETSFKAIEYSSADLIEMVKQLVSLSGSQFDCQQILWLEERAPQAVAVVVVF